jgi:hypothetical protein
LQLHGGSLRPQTHGALRGAQLVGINRTCFEAGEASGSPEATTLLQMPNPVEAGYNLPHLIPPERILEEVRTWRF